MSSYNKCRPFVSAILAVRTALNENPNPHDVKCCRNQNGNHHLLKPDHFIEALITQQRGTRGINTSSGEKEASGRIIYGLATLEALYSLVLLTKTFSYLFLMGNILKRIVALFFCFRTLVASSRTKEIIVKNILENKECHEEGCVKLPAWPGPKTLITRLISKQEVWTGLINPITLQRMVLKTLSWWP